MTKFSMKTQSNNLNQDLDVNIIIDQNINQKNTETEAPNVLPQLIILYGPPGSGKGTQANLLKTNLGYEFLDFGQSFRDFVKLNINENNSEQKRAKRVNEALIGGFPILTEDFFYILKDKILLLINSKKKFIIDKPGSLIEEATWLEQLIKEYNIPSKFIHLTLPIKDALNRITHRWYIPNNPNPFPSYSDALHHVSNGLKPFQRSDDESESISTKRIENIYGKFNDILNIYKNGGMVINDLPANDSIENIYYKILNIIKK